MAKKTTRLQPIVKQLTERQRIAVLTLMIVVGTIAVVLAVMTIVATPRTNDSGWGVGANGFRAFIDEGADLGIDNVVSKENVKTALGDKAKSVGDAEVSKVFNLNGDRSQTVSFDFTRADGKQAELYVDVMQFKDTSSMNSARIYAQTAKAGSVNGHDAYYMHAHTFGAVREYRLMAVKDLKAYKFVIGQVSGDISISEVSAVAALLKLAKEAKL